MFSSGFRWGAAVMLAMFIGLLLASPVTAFTLTPEGVRQWFSPFAAVAMVVFGIAVKYWPPLAIIPNQIIAWLNVIIFIVATTAGIETAHASVFGDAARLAGFTFADQIIRGVVHARVAKELYELMGRGLLEGVFGWRKAVPKPA